MYCFIGLIVTINNTVCSVEDEKCRRLCRFDVSISRKQVDDVHLQLITLVDKSIGNEFQGTVGLTMHDGWYNNSTHYVDILACYCSNHVEFVGCRQRRVQNFRHILLSMTLMSDMQRSTGDDGWETANFTA